MTSRLPPQGRLPEDDDDGIPLDGFHDKPKRKPKPEPQAKPAQERFGTCWVCQCPVSLDQATRVAKKALPICLQCWESIPPAERVEIGLQILADDDMRPLKQIAALVLSRIKGDAERALDGDDGLFGIFSKGN